MDLIAILNIISFCLILFALGVLINKLLKYFRKDSSFLLIVISFFLLLIISFTNLIEHLHITAFFDQFEDEIGIIFIPLFILSVFSYSLKKELQVNREIKLRIQESNIRLNMSVEGANEAMWEWHPVKKQLIIIKNYSYLSFEPILYVLDDKNWEKIVHPESKDAYKNLLNAFNTNIELPGNTEIRLKTTDNNYKWVLIRGKQCELVIEDNRITYIGTMSDIEVYKQIQEGLEKAMLKAEESEKLKTAFLNNISHEIRTPMNAIVGFTDLLNNKNLTLEKKDKYLRTIINSSHRLLQVVEDLVEMSQIMAKTIKIFNKQFNLKVLVSQIVEYNKPLALAKNLDIIFIEGKELIVSTDENKVTKILNNLIDNSLKFTHEGIIEVGYKVDENELQFYVKDTGIGIDALYQESIFDHFRQVEVSQTRQYGGFGLGLSICKGMVTILGGKIWIDSESGKGTTVHFTIPVTACETKILSTTEKTNEYWNIAILVAEDEDSNFMYIKEILQLKINKIFRALNGQDAIELVEKNPDISLILMDIKMPNMNGNEAAQIIKKMNPNIPIIAQTAYVASDQVYSCFDNYLTKPIAKESLLKMIEQYLKY